ncbi:MAG TPA: TIGR00303 family protein [Leptolyngbyaceae cyanobacterium]
MIEIYTQVPRGKQWVEQYRGCQPVFACVLGFTETGLIPGISAAGATPADREFTALADAEFLYNGPDPHPRYPLPPLHAGASPVLISRAVVEALSLPLYIFNAGLPRSPNIPVIDLGGQPARCLTTGNALELTTVEHLFQQGLLWGEKLAAHHPGSIIMVGECVVGGTTTALAVLTSLGIAATGKVNSSHPSCNHQQKRSVVEIGLQRLLEKIKDKPGKMNLQPIHPSSFIVYPDIHPMQIVAAVGDPMQIAVAGMAIAASRTSGVMLAGGTQMLAVYALIQALSKEFSLAWKPEQIAIGTTRWVVEDSTGDTVGLAQMVGSVPLVATKLSFATSRYEKLQAYERGYVKEGMGAGGCAIAAHLYAGWKQTKLLQKIEALVEQHYSQ